MFVLLASLTCAPLTVAVFNSYLMSFIVIFATESTSLSEFSSFSLENIVFGFYFCELDARLHLSEVTFSGSVIDLSSSSLMTLNTASQIFTLDNGILLWSLKLVIVLNNSV